MAFVPNRRIGLRPRNLNRQFRGMPIVGIVEFLAQLLLPTMRFPSWDSI